MSNFEFLSKEWHEIGDAAVQAELLAHTDPRTSCFYARRSLELAIEWLYAHDPTLLVPYERNLSAILREPSLRALVPHPLYHTIKKIKNLGNRSAHSRDTMEYSDALESVLGLHQFLGWLHEKYIQKPNKPFTLPAFDENFLPQQVPPFYTKTLLILQSIGKDKNWKYLAIILFVSVVGIFFFCGVRQSILNKSSMVWIRPGTFLMGPSKNEAEGSENVGQRIVSLTRGFYMSKYLVTQGEYFELMENNPSVCRGSTNLPVECVTWFDATNYCARLTAKERKNGRLKVGWLYRLPTEAEWEYACRAGTKTAFYFGDEIKGGMVNFDSHYEYKVQQGDIHMKYPAGFVGSTTPVGTYPPNPWGLYDMCGNVWEWCQDWYEDYKLGAITNPTGGTTGTKRVLRGGSFGNHGVHVRSAIRCAWTPDFTNYNPGFRVVLAEGAMMN